MTSTTDSTTPISPPLAGRTSIVTGSTSGIGAAIASSLAAAGAKVVVCGRDQERGGSVVADIRTAGGDAEFVAVDLNGSYADLRAFATEATRVLGGQVDMLVNNAGIYPVTLTEHLPDDDLDAMLAVNIRAPHVLVAALAPAMAERGQGTIVNIGSWMARTGSPSAPCTPRPRRPTSSSPAPGRPSTDRGGSASTPSHPARPAHRATPPPRRAGRHDQNHARRRSRTTGRHRSSSHLPRRRRVRDDPRGPT